MTFSVTKKSLHTGIKLQVLEHNMQVVKITNILISGHCSKATFPSLTHCDEIITGDFSYDPSTSDCVTLIQRLAYLCSRHS